MLWQKVQDSDLYVDLLENVKYSQNNRLIHRKKKITYHYAYEWKEINYILKTVLMTRG